MSASHMAKFTYCDKPVGTYCLPPLSKDVVQGLREV